MAELFSTRECAKLLGVAQHRIRYAHETGKLDDPKHWVAGKRVYTAADLKRLAEFFEVDFQMVKGNER
jgi:DNA-binding transcriptional MerR regulator